MSRDKKIRAIASLVDRQWVTMTQAARILGVAPSTVRRMIERGELHGFAIGSRYRIAEKDLFDYLIKQKAITPEVVERIHQYDVPDRGDDDEFEP